MAIEMLEQALQTWEGLSAPVRGVIESIAIVLIGLLVRAAILSLLRRRGVESRSYYTWRKGTQYAFTVIAMTMIASIWFQGVGDVATFLGLLSAGVAVALKDPLTNVVGWGYIMWQRPFTVGDRVEVLGQIGDVIDQRFFSFTMLEVGGWTVGEQSTGRVIHVPNSKIFADVIHNYTDPFSFIWEEISVVVTFESDWERAKKILHELLDERAEEIVPRAREELSQASRRTLIHYQILSPIVYTSVVDVGVRLTMRYLTPTRQRRAEEERVWEHTLRAFAEHDDIHLAYPTQRVLVG